MPLIERPCRGTAPQATPLGDGLLLSAREVPHRGELGAVVCPHGRVQREVSTMPINRLVDIL